MENKVYKLKQEYPGSPKEGTVVVEKENGYEGLGITFPHKKFVEDYPDNWELQVEKPAFRILSIINSCGDIKEGKKVIYEWIYQMYPNYIINSVQRLSDGEIFTLGDIIKSGISRSHPITKFKIFKDKILINARGHGGGLFNLTIDMIDKVKEKLFTTEDGVDVFEGDIIYHVCSLSYEKPHETKARKEIMDIPIYFHYFSTKEKAEEFVKMKKKVFSRNQVRNLLDKFHFDKGMKDYFINELEKQ